MVSKEQRFKNSERAICTGNAEVAADFMKSGGVVIASFGEIYGMFALPTFLRGNKDRVDGVQKMYEVKGRDTTKPFFSVGSPKHVEYILNAVNKLRDPSLNKEEERWLSEKIESLFTHLPENGSLGALLPGDPLLRPALIHSEQDTTGVMAASTLGIQIEELVLQLKTFFAGTSANKSGDPRANGSGANRIAPLIADFGENPNVCFFVPQSEPSGISSSAVKLNPHNKLMELVRKGNISSELLMKIAEQAGFSEGEVIQPENMKEVSKFDTKTYVGGEEAMAYIFDELISSTTQTSYQQIAPALIGLACKDWNPPQQD